MTHDSNMEWRMDGMILSGIYLIYVYHDNN